MACQRLPVDGWPLRDYVPGNMMLSSKHPLHRRALTHWVLILVLLLGQSYALAHDHDAHQGDEAPCALCVYAQQSDTFIQSAAYSQLLQTFQTGSACSARQQPAAANLLPFNSRAPPANAC